MERHVESLKRELEEITQAMAHRWADVSRLAQRASPPRAPLRDDNVWVARGGQALGKSLAPVGTVPLGILPLATISETPLAVRERESVTDPTVPQGYAPPSIQPRLEGPNVKQGRLDRVAGPSP